MDDFEVIFLQKDNISEFLCLMTDHEFEQAVTNNDICVGARIFGVPAGFGRLSFRNENTVVLSYLFVSPKYRRKGLGKKILDKLMKNEFVKDFSDICVEYRMEKGKINSVDCFLAELGFNNKRIVSVICRTDFRILDAEWFRSVRIPENFRIVKWSELDSSLKEKLKQDPERHDWENLRLSPFSQDCRDYFDLNSIAILDGDNIIGWNITTKINEKTVRYSNLYVRPKYTKLGYSIALLHKAISIQKKYRPDMDCGLWCAWAENRQMVNFITRRMSPHVDYIKYEYRREKKIL
jgi:GNAT superfamily N-acetyltransferase